jgi:hypothetical protein
LTLVAGRDRLTATLERKLSNPETSPDFDLHKVVKDVLADVGISVAEWRE